MVRWFGECEVIGMTSAGSFAQLAVGVGLHEERGGDPLTGRWDPGNWGRALPQLEPFTTTAHSSYLDHLPA